MPGGSWLKEPEAGEMSAKGAGTPRFGDFGAGKREGGFAWSEWQGNQSGMAMSGRKMGMRYDFDKMTDRRGTGSLKWDVPERELPMWVADMDFETAPEIVETLHGRVGHGVFGYSVVGEDWYRAYQGWWSRRHHLEIGGVAGVLYRGGSGHFQRCQEADHGRGECAGTDPGV